MARSYTAETYRRPFRVERHIEEPDTLPEEPDTLPEEPPAQVPVPVPEPEDPEPAWEPPAGPPVAEPEEPAVEAPIAIVPERDWYPLDDPLAAGWMEGDWVEVRAFVGTQLLTSTAHVTRTRAYSRDEHRWVTANAWHGVLGKLGWQPVEWRPL